MKRKKTRSVASYRAASLKGARTKRRMKQDPRIDWTSMTVEQIRQEIYRDLMRNPWFDMSMVQK